MQLVYLGEDPADRAVPTADQDPERVEAFEQAQSGGRERVEAFEQAQSGGRERVEVFEYEYY